MNYKKYAFELLSALNGSICYSGLRAYIESKGFVFIEFNTDNGDNTAKMLEIYDNCINCDGKTIIRNGVKTVAIDGNLCVDDKIRVTLHEIGHILLHIPNISNMVDTTVIGRENEAEAFVHEVLKMSRYGLLFKRTFRTAIAIMLCHTMIRKGVKTNEKHSMHGIRCSNDVLQTGICTEQDAAESNRAGYNGPHR